MFSGRVWRWCAIFVMLVLGACEEPKTAEVPTPAVLDRTAIGYYCSMIVADHQGPKGQIFLAGSSEPIWFSSARDTVAFTLLPDEPRDIVAVYVHDIGRADWARPEADTWIDARLAWYVIGSNKRGGMGAPEAVPFLEKSLAEGFAAEHGGQVVAFAALPEDYILGSSAQPVEPMPGHTESDRIDHASD